MNLNCYTFLLSATAVAISLFLGPTKLVSAQNENHPPSCPADVASRGGIQNGSRPTMFAINGLIEVEFQFYFGCHETPTLLDEGVRLEVRFWSAASSISTKWFPLRYYTPSFVVTNDDTSLVQLDPSNDSATAQAFTYNSSLPLILVQPSQSAVLIREYICIQYIQNYTEDLKMQLRWMQKFGRGFEQSSGAGRTDRTGRTEGSSRTDRTGRTGGSSRKDRTGRADGSSRTGRTERRSGTDRTDTTGGSSRTSRMGGTNKRRKRMMEMLKKYAGWILDDINIRIWNGTHFLQVLSEDFNGNDINNLNFESYELRLAAVIQDEQCKSSENDYHLQFNLEDSKTTTRYLTFNVTNISLSYEERGPGFCTANQTVHLNVSYSWMETEVGGYSSLPCNFTSGVAIRQCGLGEWLQPDISHCERADNILNQVLNETVNLETLEDQLNRVAFVLRITESDYDQQTPMFLFMLSTCFTSVSVLIVSNETTVISYAIVMELVQIIYSLQKWSANVFVETAGSSMLAPHTVNQITLMVTNFNILYSIIMSFESVFTQYAQNLRVNQTVTISVGDFVLVAQNLPLARLLSFGHSLSLSEVISKESEAVADNLMASITLPSSVFANISNRTQVGLFFALYRRSTLFPIRETENATNAVDGRTTIVASPIIAATVGRGLSFYNLLPQVAINLSIPTRINDSVILQRSAVCVSWNFSAAGNRGNWTTEGCTTVGSSNGVVTCQCSHLTNFAVLIDICSRIKPNGCLEEASFDRILSVITVIGVALSLIGLILTDITILAFKRLRDHDATKFHFQLTLAIFFMLVVFVTGVDKTAVVGGCMAASILIHYFTLASILWMLAESLLLFQKLVFVFKQITKKSIIITSLVCWMAPLVPVAISLIVDLANGSEASTDLIINREKFCFLSNPIVFWLAFLGPTFAVILINSVIFIIVIVILVRQTRGRLRHMKNSLDLKTFVRLMISASGIMFLFGISWLFAALTITVKEIRKPGQVLFVLFNSLQGFFIFVFFCILGKEARESWKEVLSCGQYESVYLKPTLKLSKNTVAMRNHAGIMSSMDCTSNETLSRGTLNNKKRSSGITVELKFTTVVPKNGSNIYSEPAHHGREEKKDYLSGTYVSKKDENHKSSSFSETQLNELKDLSVIKKREDNEPKEVAEVVQGINTYNIYENVAVVLVNDEGEDDISGISIK